METHVKVLGVLQIVIGAFGLFAAVALMAAFGVAGSVVAAVDDPDAAIALPIIGLTGTALVAVLLLLSLPNVIAGIGLIRLRPWARIAGIVLSILGLAIIPFGTIVGIYGIWVLFSKDTERLFASPASEAGIEN
jgi:hypothetical protein